MVALQHTYLPRQFAVDGNVLGSPIQQVSRQELTAEAAVQPFPINGVPAQLVTVSGGTAVLVAARNVPCPPEADEVIVLPGGVAPAARDDWQERGGQARWLMPLPLDPAVCSEDDLEALCDRVRASWRGRFSIREESQEDGVLVTGLRAPQVGALYATLAHWKVGSDPATIVMPTGTGKTETMLSVFVHQRLLRLLVVVPTSALRAQTAEKFLTLGVLPALGIVGDGILYPIVGTLEHYLTSPADVEAYFRRCNVVVTTMAIVNGCPSDAKTRIAELCSHLFIDEAHHATAPTWREFRLYFEDKNIVQFTATPFRNDGQHIPGRVVFNYPLRKAQEEGFFKPIRFVPVSVFSDEAADREIAQAAVAVLDQDLARGLDHLVMARTATIDRAGDVYNIYLDLAPGHSPLLIHSKLPAAEKRAAVVRLREKKSRIIVCVDMLGEGFDLPELKIAALHDMHKSLAITLQFTGRFTRTKPNLGDAAMIANVANPKVQDALRDLYAEDSDWNFLLREMSEGATGHQVRRSEFLEAFTNIPRHIPLQNVFPKMSTVAYRTTCNAWQPTKIHDVVDDERLYAEPTSNRKDEVALFVTREREPIPWGSIKDIANTTYDLYVLHWDSEHALLYINSSNNDSLHEDLAKAVAGDDVALIRGDVVFRAFHGIHLLILMNLGLKHAVSRAIRFSMHVGPDIGPGLSDAHLQNRIKSNVFGLGYMNGDKVTLGCALKGRLWSYKAADSIADWVDWCHGIGAKLLDESIAVPKIFEQAIVPEVIQARPALVPIIVEWPEELLKRSEDSILLDFGRETVPFFDVGLELVDPRRDGPLRFRVTSESASATYEVQLGASSVQYVPIGEETTTIVLSRKRIVLSKWFQQTPPVIRFEDGSYLDYNELYRLFKDGCSPFPRDRIQTWDWSGTNISKESQYDKTTGSKDSDSIQFRVIQDLLHPSYDPQYDIIFDDDDKDEAADVVAIKIAGGRLLVHFFHCKYSSKPFIGARLDDLYALCGQAQRSASWYGRIKNLIDHLCEREDRRLKRSMVSRFERGSLQTLDNIGRQLRLLQRPEFRVCIIQPGYSKNQAEDEHLKLLGVTDLYLKETFELGFDVIVSS